MRLSVKLLDGQMFTVDIEQQTQVGELKLIIEATRSDLPAAIQVVIFNGKVLKDNDVLTQVGVEEGNFVVCMVKKKPAASTTSAPQPVTTSRPTQAPASSTSVPSVPPTSAPTAPAPILSVPPVATSPPTQQAPPQTQFQQPQPQPQPQQPAIPDAIVQQLVGMGFPETEVRAALQAAGGIPDIAIDFLFNGIPDDFPPAHHHHHHQQQQVPQFEIARHPQQQQQQRDPLEALRSHPQINTLRAMVQQNPSSLPVVLEQIGRASPDLLQLIHQHRDQFIQLLNEPITNAPTATVQPELEQGRGVGAESILAFIQGMPANERHSLASLFGMTPERFTQMIASLPPEQLQQMLGGLTGMGGQGFLPELTPEESEAVNRLIALGFEEEDVLEAFLACDKNEMLAANYLYDNCAPSQGQSRSTTQSTGAPGSQNPPNQVFNEDIDEEDEEDDEEGEDDQHEHHP